MSIYDTDAIVLETTDSQGQTIVHSVWHEYYVEDPETGDLVEAEPPAQTDEVNRKKVSKIEVTRDNAIDFVEGRRSLDALPSDAVENLNRVGRPSQGGQ